jgi:hypothetical protein
VSTGAFLDRVWSHLDGLEQGRFSVQSWRFDRRPTSEAVGGMPADVDVEAMVGCILDVPGYLKNVRYVDDIDVREERGPGDVTYLQRVNLPALGKVQTVLRLTDVGEREGYRVVLWEQDEHATAALDKKQGARTAYNLGGWLLKPDRVLYALSSAPVKEDVGSLKFAVMTKGADAIAGETLKGNIEGMLAWAKRVREG